MRLKNRVDKLEKDLSIKHGTVIYLCFMDEKEGLCKIPKLNFEGNMDQAKKLMDSVERESPEKVLFITTQCPRPEIAN